MDPRATARVLAQIAAFLELRGESRFKSGAYEQAARTIAALDTDDLGALDRSGELARTPGIGKAILGVIRDLEETGESQYLQQLREGLPAGLTDLLRVPGLATAKIRLLHETLGIDSVDALEAAARDGRLAALKGFGPKTAAKLLRGIEIFRSSGSRSLYHRAMEQGQAFVAAVRGRPDVVRAELAGSLRRHGETIGDIDIVAACSGDPVAVATSLTHAAYCVAERDFVVAFWRATGSDQHVRTVLALLARQGVTLDGDTLRDARSTPLEVTSEEAIYRLVDLPFIPPEMREEGAEFLLAVAGRMPVLLEPRDIRGALHCHTDYSDGKATVAEMAEAARARGWSYIGITDHSLAAFYAGGLSRERVLEQHAEIDALNVASPDFRILKGIEADILADGALDYDEALLARFDFVVGSVHSRFAMDKTRMTERVLRALDDPHLTILGHPTGRLLLSRDPYPIDMNAVLEKAAALGVAVELNADPKRLDLDWRLLPRARELGVAIEIGPDAHSTRGLDTMAIGVGIARKGGLEASDVLNARSAEEVLAFARARRGAQR